MADISIQKVNNNDTGYLSRKKLNENNELLAKAVNEKVDRSEISNFSVGLKRYQPEVATVEDLPESGNTAGDGRRVLGDLNTEGFAYIWLWDGNEWGRTPFTSFPGNVVTQPQLNEVQSQIVFKPAFSLESVIEGNNSNTAVIWCNDYYAAEIQGIRFKARTGTLYVYVVNIKTNAYRLVDTIIIEAAQNATIVDHLFENTLQLSPNERLGVNGSVFYGTAVHVSESLLFPKMYTLTKATNSIAYQTDATLAYALITPVKNTDKVQVSSNKTEALESSVYMGEPIAKDLLFKAGLSGGSGENIITTCNLLQVKESGLITSISANVKKDTDTMVVLGDVIDGVFYESERVVFKSAFDNITTVPTSIYAIKGQYVGFYKPSSKFIYALTAYGNSKFMQIRYPNFTTASVNRDGWIGLSYTLKPIPTMDIDITNNGYTKATFHNGVNAPRNSYKSISGNKWVTFTNSVFSFEGTIRKIWVDVETAGNITIGIGLIDQRGWAIVDSTQVINCPNAGLNEIEVSIPLEQNKRLFLKSPVSIGVSTGGRHLESNDGGIILSAQTDELIFKYEIEGKRFVESSVARKSEVNDLNSTVSDLTSTVNSLALDSKYKQSPDGSYWEQTIDNNGQASWQKVVAKKVSVFGNSFDLHPISELWWGRFGMAASRRENDWVHQLQTKLRNVGILSTITPYSIAETVDDNKGWETNPGQFDYTRLDPYLQPDTDLVIIRIGENSPNQPTLTEDTKVLIDYIRAKVPNVPIIFGGVFWTNQDKQAKLKAAADYYGNIPFIDFQDLDVPEYKSAIGNLTLGDDGVWHEITHAGVANHAGDKGMEAMANRILPYAVSVLN